MLTSMTFDIAPAGYRPFLLLAPIAVLIIGICVLLVATLGGARGASFEVAEGGLRLRGDFYGRFIPARELLVDSARRVDFDTEPGLAPRGRTWGTGLPGYQAGWFRLEDGSKALLYLTDRQRAVFVPTTRGHGLLLSPKDPDGFLAALRSVRGDS